MLLFDVYVCVLEEEEAD